MPSTASPGPGRKRRRATEPAFASKDFVGSTIVTLSSDFGTVDGYAGAMKGAVMRDAPTARVVDITHDIHPGDVRGGALALEAAAPFFPSGTIHILVVDPGVGTRRRAIAVEAADAVFVGPDNGVLSLAATGPRRVYALDRPERHLGKVSATFHGRDVFAPIAALLAKGARLRDLGTPVPDMKDLELPTPIVSTQSVVGAVIHADRFGNLLTNITTGELRGLVAAHGAANLTVTVGRRAIGRIVKTYADAEHGALLALIGSSGRLEIAVREGSAAGRLRRRPGIEAAVRVVGKRA